MKKAIRLKTKIPGPKSKRLLKQKIKETPKGLDLATKIFVQKANNSLITDVDGNVFIDFSSGISACNSGHNNLKMVNAIISQAKKYIHTCFTIVPYEPFIAVAKKLNRITPGNFPKKTALFNSGAEAVENAIKIARKHTQREAIVSFEHGFHGRTLLTLSLTSKVKPYKFGFGPFDSETYKLPYPYTYRMPGKCLTEDEYIDSLFEDIENNFFKGVVAPEDIAAIIMEPVTGEGGFIIPPKRYVQELAKICRKNNILFIADEVQTGFGRTGRLFASEHFGIKPDIITTAKSLSNGMPLSAVTGKKKIMDSVQEGGLGGTFAGHALACASALEAIDFIIKQKLPQRAQKIGKIIMPRFKELEAKIPIVGEARGLGAMCAMEFVHNKTSKKPFKEAAVKVSHKALQKGLILLYAGVLGNDIRTLSPLTIPFEQLNEGLDVIDEAVTSVGKQSR